jgi:hypothetical protein
MDTLYNDLFPMISIFEHIIQFYSRYARDISSINFTHLPVFLPLHAPIPPNYLSAFGNSSRQPPFLAPFFVIAVLGNTPQFRGISFICFP